MSQQAKPVDDAAAAQKVVERILAERGPMPDDLVQKIRDTRAAARKRPQRKQSD